MDPAQVLKTQIGELVWANAVLNGRVVELEKERDELKTRLDQSMEKKADEANV